MKKIFKILFVLLSLTISTSCSDEPVDVTASEENVIKVDSELYNSIEAIIRDSEPNTIEEQVCVNFNYPFTLLIYDVDLVLINSQTITDSDAFSSFLETLDPSYSISLSYPITSYFDNGESVTINNNDELKLAIDRCLEEEFINYCNGALPSEDCIWDVNYLEDGDNLYDDAYFEVNEDGTVTFYYNDTTFSGTWTTLFIEEETHLNINLLDDTQVGIDWNFDWLITLNDAGDFVLENGTDTYILHLNCDLSCADLTFEECELEETPGVAEFNLDSYTDCILSQIDITDPSLVTVTYHETQEDAETFVNAISSPYNNTDTSQTIFVRIEDTETGDISYTGIQIEVITCN